MKKLLPLIIGIFFTGTLIAQSIPDGSFEYWNTLTWQDPTHFSTSNDQIFGKGGSLANVTRVAGYHGSYGVQFQTSLLSPGYMIDGNSNGNGFTGGIPYSQQPTGIRFYYKYAPVTGDTAAVLVIFRKSSVTIDSFLILLDTAKATYTMHSYIPNTLVTAPDSVIVAAVSSFGAINGSSGHIGSVFTIDSMSFTGVASQPTNLNGDFEAWTSDTLFVPTGGWYTNLAVTRTTDAKTGTYALELQTVNDPGNGPNVGQAGTAYYPNNCQGNCYAIGGKAYTTQIDTLEFSYKYAPHSTDTAGVQLTFFKNGLAVQTGAHQFYTGINLSGTNATYKDTSLAFNVGFAPDSVQINLQSSQHNNLNGSQYAPFEGSVFKVDNLTFASQKHFLGVSKVSTTETSVKVYPNPTKDVLNFQFTNVSGAAQLSVYDITGREIKQSSISINSSNIELNTSGMSPGIYFYRVITANGSFENKFVKE